MATKLRFATPDDAAGVLSIYAPYCESSFVSFEIVAPTEAQMRERIERIIGRVSVAGVRHERASRRLCLCQPASGAGRISVDG